MFGALSRGWEAADLSYSLLLKNKRLILFPFVSSIAGWIVMASFALPLWKMGMLSQWWSSIDSEFSAQGDVSMYVIAFLFYFATYFTIVFFNTALVACAIRMIEGQEASISYGFSFAVKRLPQIFGWALVSAIIGVLLKAIENSHEKAGWFISSLFGAAWTVLTFFVVPVIVVEGVGPVEAVKRSAKTMKSTWGTALMGNFALGLFGLIVWIPVILFCICLVWGAMSTESSMLLIAAFAISGFLVMFAGSATSAADTILKVYLYSYATDRPLPDYIDTSKFKRAFRQRNDSSMTNRYR